MKSDLTRKLKRLPDFLAALIFLQTLYFKFSAAPESVFIFSFIGLEPEGRIGIGILELISAILLIFPRTSWIGGGLALGVISGAIVMHLTVLGIEVQNDGGLLFALALIVFVCSTFVVYRERLKFISLFSR
jgi:hypothetical protein